MDSPENLKTFELSSCGTIKTPAEMDFYRRLDAIYSSISSITDEFEPGMIAVEKLFFNENVKTAIDVGQARGVVLLSLEHYNSNREELVEITEINPLTVKKTLTGNGKSDKKSVQKIVKQELNLREPPEPDDTADALAAALSVLIKNRFPSELEEFDF